MLYNIELYCLKLFLIVHLMYNHEVISVVKENDGDVIYNITIQNDTFLNGHVKLMTHIIFN